MTLSIEIICEMCLPLHNAGNKVSCKQVRPVNHFCVTIPFKFTANQIDRIDVNPSAVRQRMTQVYLSFLLYSSPVFNEHNLTIPGWQIFVKQYLEVEKLIAIKNDTYRKFCTNWEKWLRTFLLVMCICDITSSILRNNPLLSYPNKCCQHTRSLKETAAN